MSDHTQPKDGKETDKTKTPEKKTRKAPQIMGRIIVLAAVAGGLFFGSVKLIDSIKYISTDDASIDGRTIKLASKMLGRISSIDIEEGDLVKAGDSIVTLDAHDLKAQETQSQAALSYARRNMNLAEINLGKSRDDFERISSLYRSSAATKENYDHAQSALNVAQAQYDLAQSQVDTSRAQMGVIEAQLLNTEIRTPISGTVDAISLSAGDIVQPGQTILTINDLSDIWIIANIEETKIAKIKPGADVLVTVDAFGRTPVNGRVEKIRSGIVAPAFQIGEFTKTTRRIPVRISLSAESIRESGFADVRLVPGMSVEVKIRTQAKLPGFLNG